MEYDSKNILHFSHIDGSSHDIYQGFLELFFDYLGELIASVSSPGERQKALMDIN